MHRLISQEEYEQLYVDAMAYRYLRDSTRLKNGERGLYVCKANNADYYAPLEIYGDELDSAILEAQKKGKNNNV